MCDLFSDAHGRPAQAGVLAVVDGYEQYLAAPKSENPADIEWEVRIIMSLVKAHGPENRVLAVVHHDDKLREAAYKRVGCLVYPMNGDRPAELQRLVGIEADQMTLHPPRKLIIMGGDAAYGPLCVIAHSIQSEVLVWPVNGQAVAPQLEPYALQSLSDLLPDPRAQAPAVTVKLDAENHLYGLWKASGAVRARTYLAAVEKAVADLGNVVSIQAAADWKVLRETLGQDYQWEFERSGIRTVYSVNIPGKNTSDVALAGSIYESLERDPNVDIYVLGTGDCDFTPVVEAIHARGKQVYVIGLRTSVGRKLREIADGVRYLDDYLDRPALPKTSSSGREPSSASLKSPAMEELATVLQVVDFLARRNWAYAYFDRLPEAIDRTKLRAAIGHGMLRTRTQGEANSVALNLDHSVVQQAQLLVSWLRRQLRYRLKVLPYVDTNLLARDMQEDPCCRDVGLGRTRNEAAAWLEAAASVGLVVKKRQPTPKNPTCEVDTWSL
ncbi:MAG: NYN domain-containing protein [Nitrososphaerales archaeon]